jgi:hypothetical protein
MESASSCSDTSVGGNRGVARHDEWPLGPAKRIVMVSLSSMQRCYRVDYISDKQSFGRIVVSFTGLEGECAKFIVMKRALEKAEREKAMIQRELRKRLEKEAKKKAVSERAAAASIIEPPRNTGANLKGRSRKDGSLGESDCDSESSDQHEDSSCEVVVDAEIIEGADDDDVQEGMVVQDFR